MNKEWKNFCAKLALLSTEDCKNTLDCHPSPNGRTQKCRAEYKRDGVVQNIRPLNVFPLATFSVTFPLIKKHLSCSSVSNENNWQGHMLNAKSCAFLAASSVFCSVTSSFQSYFNIADSLAVSKVCFKMC